MAGGELRGSSAFSPGNVSLIFRIVEGKCPGAMHSLGVGFTTSAGVVCTVTSGNGNTVRLNGRPAVIAPVDRVIGAYGAESVSIGLQTKLPIGAGFGISGACALSASLALNKYLNAEKSSKACAMIAHVAEVESGTGLGDVGGQYSGGFNMKVRRGRPLDVVPLKISKRKLFYRFFSKIDTKQVISDRKRRGLINKAADKALSILKSAKTKDILPLVFALSRNFSVESGLLRSSKVKDAIGWVEKKGGQAAMIMLGNSVVSTIPFAASREIWIGKRGAHLL